MAKAPFGGAATGANPTDRGKRGTKRSQLSDGRGMPLAVVVDGANRTDMKLAEATLDAILITRPMPIKEQPQHVCLDASYDYETIYETVRAHHYEPHIRPNLHNRAQVRTMPEPEEESRASLWLLLDNPEGACSRNGLCAVTHAQFREDIAHVSLDGIKGDNQCLGDLLVGSTLRE